MSSLIAACLPRIAKTVLWSQGKAHASIFDKCEPRRPGHQSSNEVQRRLIATGLRAVVQNVLWQQTARFRVFRWIVHLRCSIRELRAEELPPQFLYLALQESGLRYDAVGPRTRYGHAKGMWQFIPDTAKRYGLTPGPLQHLGRYDPNDDRHNVAKATRAAARYLKDFYRTDAQASDPSPARMHAGLATAMQNARLP